MYGDRRPLRIHYYLEDSTVEILEDYEQNSGRERFPVFLQRSQLPKVVSFRLSIIHGFFTHSDFAAGRHLYLASMERVLHSMLRRKPVWPHLYTRYQKEGPVPHVFMSSHHRT